MTNATPTPEAILWRGIRFEPAYGSKAVTRFDADRLPGLSLRLWHNAKEEPWSAEFNDSLGDGYTPEEALEAARSQVGAIARAVGLIPDVEECIRLLGCVAEKTVRSDIHAVLNQLAAKLGKGER